MTWGLVAVAGATVVGGVLSSNAAGKAANAQTNAANQANATQQANFNTIRNDNQPFAQGGYSAYSELLNRLGIASKSGGHGGASGPADWATYLTENPDVATEAQKQISNPKSEVYGMSPEGFAAWHYNTYGQGEGRNLPTTTSKQEATSTDPNYGSLLKPFTGADLQNDPGYQFGLNQQMGALQSSQAARGGLYSGAALKAANRYAGDYASTKYNEAYNRDASDKNSVYNKLMGVTGVGQASVNQTAAAGSANANAQSSNLLGAGNAQAAGAIGQANAITGAIGQGVNYYQNNQLMNSLRGSSYDSTTGQPMSYNERRVY